MSQPEHAEAAREAAIRAKLDSWKNAPVILASTSLYRQTELRRAGWADVDTRAVPDAIEDQIVRQTPASFLKLDHNPFDSRLTQSIAEAKVSHVLRSESVPQETMVCAMDTMPRVFHLKEGDTLSDVLWRGDFLRKPKTIAEARKMIKRTLNHIIKNYRSAQQPEAPTKKVSLNREQRIYYEIIKSLAAEIEINTGIAIRIPGETRIKTETAAIYLVPEQLYAIADKTSSKTAESLTEEIISAMQESGVPTTDIAGGIDFADPKIIRILGLKEVPLEKQTFGFYRGLPIRSLQDFLLTQAEEHI